MIRPLRKLLRTVLNIDPGFYDMYADEPTRLAGEEYLQHIRRYLKQTFGDAKLDMLDAGCQAGRLLIPLARDGHRMIGLDTSGFSLRRARQHAKQYLLPLRLQRANISGLRRWIKPVSLDVVISTEVLYLCPDYRSLLGILSDSVKPGGLLFISHRTPEYYIWKALQQGQTDLAAEIKHRSEGPSPEGKYHNWQTPQELSNLYRGCGLKELECIPMQFMDTSTYNGSISNRIPSYFFVIAQK